MGIVSICIFSYYPAQQKREALSSIHSKIKDIRNLLTIGVGIGLEETDLVAVSEAMEWVNDDSALVYIGIQDNRNMKIALHNPHNIVLSQYVLSNIKNDEIFKSDNILYCKSSIIYQKYFLGTLFLGYSLKGMHQKNSNLKTTTLYFCLVFYALGVISSLIVSGRITNNIRKLNEAVNLITKGNLQANAKVESNDEIGKLSKAFNQMVHNQNRSREELISHANQLQKQNQELNQFSYVVSHDLKAPLQAIFKLSEWIQEDLGTTIPEPVKNKMTILRARILRLESLINGLLEYAKIGRMKFASEKVDIEAMLHEVIDLLSPSPKFKINIRTGKLVFQTKIILLQQVFFNLISNAIKYNDKEIGEINITANVLENFYEFTVEDNGMGIDPIYHEKIFVVFQMLEARDKIEGTGVGLAIIKKSVEDMGGIIKLESLPGKGSKFLFTWPIKTQHNALPSGILK